MRRRRVLCGGPFGALLRAVLTLISFPLHFWKKAATEFLKNCFYWFKKNINIDFGKGDEHALTGIFLKFLRSEARAKYL